MGNLHGNIGGTTKKSYNFWMTSIWLLLDVALTHREPGSSATMLFAFSFWTALEFGLNSVQGIVEYLDLLREPSHHRVVSVTHGLELYYGVYRAVYQYSGFTFTGVPVVERGVTGIPDDHEGNESPDHHARLNDQRKRLRTPAKPSHGLFGYLSASYLGDGSSSGTSELDIDSTIIEKILQLGPSGSVAVSSPSIDNSSRLMRRTFAIEDAHISPHASLVIGTLCISILVKHTAKRPLNGTLKQAAMRDT
ncbi:hypothetical protein BU15DRAFT_80613 [Melanogaster broomeanus]|nr:hypothetical protein BU15DRAFT_80613 [Melanogaster broomeanus]